jgi:hypothetical protein
MKKIIICCLVVFGCTASAYAIKTSLFINIERSIERSPAVFIAKSVLTSSVTVRSTHLIESIKIEKVLKGDAKPGHAKLARLNNLGFNKTYLIFSSGGSIKGADYLSFAELSAVEMPSNFNLDQLNNKKLKDQVTLILNERNNELNRRVEILNKKLDSLNNEKKLLEKALK